VATDEPGQPEHERFERLRDAALEAEFETGTREETVAEARAHIVLRLARMTAGFLVVVLGLLLVPLPGPGWLIVLGGLLILSKDFAWAERTIAIVRKRIPTDADGRIQPRTRAAMGAMSAMGIAASVWWTVLR